MEIVEIRSEEEEKKEEIKKQLELTNENKEKISLFIKDHQDKYDLSKLEIKQEKNESIVRNLMFNLHLIINEVDEIKAKFLEINKKKVINSVLPKKVTKTNVKERKEFNSDVLNTSTMSKRSQTSIKNKFTPSNKLDLKNQSIKRNLFGSTIKDKTDKNETNEEDVIIVPNKFQIISPKVSINISIKKEKINLEEKSNNNKNSVIKKINSKQNNYSIPNANLNKTMTKNTTNSAKLDFSGNKSNKTPLKTRGNNYGDENNTSLEESMKLNSTYKFQPKKRNVELDPEIHSSELFLTNTSMRNDTLNDSNIFKDSKDHTRNVSNNTLNDKSMYKTIKKDLSLPLNIKNNFSNHLIENLFINESTSKCINKIFSFLTFKENKILRTISTTANKEFFKYKLVYINNLLKKKEGMLNSDFNPFTSLSLISSNIELNSLIQNCLKTELKLSFYYNCKNSIHLQLLLTSFIDCVYCFYLCNESSKIDFSLNTNDKIEFLEKLTKNGNCYELIERIIQNIKQEKRSYDFIKQTLNKKQISLSFLSDMNSSDKHNSTFPIEFKYYLELFKSCKKVLDDDFITVTMVEVEILSAKIEKFKKKFNYN